MKYNPITIFSFANSRSSELSDGILWNDAAHYLHVKLLPSDQLVRIVS